MSQKVVPISPQHIPILLLAKLRIVFDRYQENTHLAYEIDELSAYPIRILTSLRDEWHLFVRRQLAEHEPRFRSDKSLIEQTDLLETLVEESSMHQRRKIAQYLPRIKRAMEQLKQHGETGQVKAVRFTQP